MFSASKVVKKYIIISISIVVLTILALALINNTMFIINSDQKFTVKGIKNDGDSNIFKIGSLHFIPRSVDSIRLSPSDGNDKIPEKEIIKSLTDDDKSLGVHSYRAEFVDQYSLSMNGNESRGCMSGEYPNIISHDCDVPNGVLLYNASDLMDDGEFIELPPSPLDVALGVNPIDSKRSTAFRPYKKGVLVMLAEYNEPVDTPLSNVSFRSIDGTGEITESEVSDFYGKVQQDQLQLITDANGGDGFGVVDILNHNVYYYKNLTSQPVKTELKHPEGEGITTICSLNSSLLACFSGLVVYHPHDEGDVRQFELMSDGQFTIKDVEKNQIINELTVPKEKPIDNICLDSKQNMYTMTEESIDKITIEGQSLKQTPIIYKATDISCGSTIHYVAENKVYSLTDSNTSNLVYSSEELPVRTVVSHGTSVNIMAGFKSIPDSTYSLTASKPSKPHQSERTSDIIARVVNGHGDAAFDISFDEDSLDLVASEYWGMGLSDLDPIVRDIKKSAPDLEVKTHLIKVRESVF